MASSPLVSSSSVSISPPLVASVSPDTDRRPAVDEPSLKRSKPSDDTVSNLMQLIDPRVAQTFNEACKFTIPCATLVNTLNAFTHKLQKLLPIAQPLQIAATLNGLNASVGLTEIIAHLIKIVLMFPYETTLTSFATFSLAADVLRQCLHSELENTVARVAGASPVTNLIDPYILQTQVSSILAELCQMHASISRMTPSQMEGIRQLATSKVLQAVNVINSIPVNIGTWKLPIVSPFKAPLVRGISIFGNQGADSPMTSLSSCTTKSPKISIDGRSIKLDLSLRADNITHDSACPCMHALQVPHSKWTPCAVSTSRLAQFNIWAMLRRISAGNLEQYQPQILNVLVDELALMHGEVANLAAQDRTQTELLTSIESKISQDKDAVDAKITQSKETIAGDFEEKLTQNKELQSKIEERLGTIEEQLANESKAEEVEHNFNLFRAQITQTIEQKESVQAKAFQNLIETLNHETKQTNEKDDRIAALEAELATMKADFIELRNKFTKHVFTTKKL